MIHLIVSVANTAELLAVEAFGADALLRWESSATKNGTYTEGGTVPLVSGQSEYHIWDADGVTGTWYRTRVSDDNPASTYSQYTSPRQGGQDPRISMVDLILRLRRLTGDVAATPAFSDDQLQDFLDERRTDVVEAGLRYRLSGTATLARTFFAPRRWWEDSVALVDGAGAALEPDSEDLVVGRWTFAAGQSIPVFISGAFFDMYGTAAAVLEAWAALEARSFDFSTDQQDFSRSQKREGLLATALEYRRKSVQPGIRPAWRSTEW